MRRTAAIALAPAFTLAACGHTTERDHLDFERMRVQQRYDLYGASSVFANGLAMQAPPPGTVARETIGDTGVVATGTFDGVAVTAIPIALSAEQHVSAAKNFRVYCAVCHGAAGFGGSIVAENMGPPRPPSLRSARLAAMPVGYIFIVATHGLGRMPSYAPELTATERWAVAAYVKQLQSAPAATRQAVDDSLRAIEIQRIDSTNTARRAS